MKAYWQNLSAREQLILAIGAVVLIVVSVIQFIIVPTFDWRSSQERRMQQAKILYELVVEAAPLGAAASTASANAIPPRTAITETARRLEVTLIYVNSRDDGAIDVNVAASSPQRVFEWIGVLRDEHSVTVLAADVARDANDPETVRAQLTFRGGGGR